MALQMALQMTMHRVLQDGSTEVIAPVGFTAAAASENILAGPTMSRRSMFMYGSQLEQSPKGHVDSGLGKAPALGSVGIAKPTRSIRETGEQITIDGVEFIFQNAENSEVPAELTFYLPEHGAFCGAELVSRTMHNLYTLRGAQVRDALSWSQHIDDALHLFGNADIYAFMPRSQGLRSTDAHKPLGVRYARCVRG